MFKKAIKVTTYVFIFVLLSMVVGTFVFGTSPSDDASIKGGSNQLPSSSIASPAELNLKIDEIAKTNKLEISILSAEKKKSYTYYSDIFEEMVVETSSPGNTFIVVDAEIKYIGSDSTYVDNGFSVTDSEGYKYDPELYGGDDGLEFFKELYSNQKTKGRIIFSVPESATNLKIQYNFGNIFAGTKLATWWVEKGEVSGVSYPQLTEFVTDNANMIDSSYEVQISALAEQIEQKTTVEIAVVTVESLEGESREVYAVNLFNQAGIGKKDKGNGLLILVAKQEREYRFEIGYGLEGIIEDNMKVNIGEWIIVPNFKNGDYGKGIYESLVVIEGLLEGDEGVISQYTMIATG